VAMRWLKGSLCFRLRFLLLSKQALLDPVNNPVKTADIHSIQSKDGIPPRCLSGEDCSLVRKGYDFQTVQRYLQHSKNQIDIEKGIKSDITILTKLEFEVRHRWYSNWIDSKGVKKRTMSELLT
jgi:hypothetical protein